MDKIGSPGRPARDTPAPHNNDDAFTLADWQALAHAVDFLFAQKLGTLTSAGFISTSRFNADKYTADDFIALRRKVVLMLGRGLVRHYGGPTVTCPPCKGSGHRWGASDAPAATSICPECNGTGRIGIFAAAAPTDPEAVMINGRTLHIGRLYWIQDSHSPHDGWEVILRAATVGSSIGQVEALRNGCKFMATLATLQEVHY